MRLNRRQDGDATSERGVEAAGACEGVVTRQLPSGLYEVGVEGRHRITAHVGGGLDRNFVRLLVGDRVVVEVSARDVTRGRIVRKA